MPLFRVLRRVDAFVDYTTEVEAPTAELATRLARQNADKLTWSPEGQHEFDAQLFVALDADGREVDGTECGDF